MLKHICTSIFYYNTYIYPTTTVYTIAFIYSKQSTIYALWYSMDDTLPEQAINSHRFTLARLRIEKKVHLRAFASMAIVIYFDIRVTARLADI